MLSHQITVDLIVVFDEKKELVHRLKVSDTIGLKQFLNRWGGEVLMTNENTYKAIISNKFRTVRIKAGLKQYELAEKLGVTANYISLIENGKKKPSLRLIHKAADVFNVRASTLIEDEPILNDLRELSNKYNLEEIVKGLKQLIT